ncbi:hypothetical protein KTC96_09980 [Clostridium estertheticum]|uniref:hypothetical protein n=1 Tax=Clostridium estertheticum TaxID=238834 RepID=UPI001C7DCF55|nr:hypothetical protein [Clostridium estertheticum]MBX4262459.1 hypothetical protein [Clostridium estertheticum]WLC72270.1 hypothetical protein KTC96_09980 [Clostridium estertheticum]
MRLWLRFNDYEEYDVKFGSWQIYSHIYKDNFHDKIIYDEDVVVKEKRPYITRKFKYNSKISKELDFSGETDFNFSKKRIFGLGDNRYNQYKKLIKKEYLDNPSKYKEYITKLEECEKKLYSQANISLMPKTGGLQLVKKGVGNDRLDVFIWTLNEYYEYGITSQVFSTCSCENMEYLKSFLDLFENVNEYCEAVYHIDKELSDDLCVSGSKMIDSAERVIKYMELADRFWTQKEKYINKAFEVQ